MIATKSAAPKEDFEALLDTTIKNLNIAIETAPTMSNADFENSVARAMNLAAKGTVFEGQIKQTGDMEFPDIVAGGFYGVEVKKTTKNTFKTTGNSIFEQSRVSGVQSIYIIMANPDSARWTAYENAIEDIVVTHSPRYSINLDASTTVFETMGVEYDDFRGLNQSNKMELIRQLYKDSSLWWLANKQDGIEYRFWNGLPPSEKDTLMLELMIVCPQVFSKNYRPATVYCLGMGIINPSMRDVFSSGGTVRINGSAYPAIYGRLYKWKDDIRGIFPTIDTETLASFWVCAIQSDIAERWQQWLGLVKSEGGRDVSQFFG